MNKCQFCGKDRNNIKHRLAYIKFDISDSGKPINIKEFWECTVTGERYEGKLCEKASEEAKNDYHRRRKLFVSDSAINTFNLKDAKHFKDRGICYYELKKYKQAIADLNEVISLNPKDSDSHYLCGKSYECLGKNDLAIRNFMAAARLGHREAKDYLNKKGIKW